MLTELHSMNEAARAALTQFATDYDPENPPWKKKEKGMGGAVAGAAAIGAGGYGVHRGVMRNSNSGAGTGAFGRTPTKAGVVQSYKNAGADIVRNVSEAGQQISHRWQNPAQRMSGPGTGAMGRTPVKVDPTTVDRVKSAGAAVGAQGKQLLKKMVRTIFHYDAIIPDLTEMNAQAQEALVQFASDDARVPWYSGLPIEAARNAPDGRRWEAAKEGYRHVSKKTA